MATCPYCGLWIDNFDYELTGGHRECLQKLEEEDNATETYDEDM